MNSREIAALITERANCFRDRNLQQFEQLASRLQKLERGTVADGLLRVFSEGSAPPAGSPAQELAGALLAKLTPRGAVNLESFLRAALPRYELSVEQLPVYLAQSSVQGELESVLGKLEREEFGVQHRRAIETFRFWLRNNPTQQAPHEA
jgi:hypothetical protein